MQTPLKLITHLFPVWALLLSAIAFYFPAPFAALKPGIIPLLAVIMLGMGMTLTLDDFKRVGQQPVIILIGVCCQFLVMPLAAYVIAVGLNLPLALLTGMMLVGASSGGTASNVICYLAKGDVGFSLGSHADAHLVVSWRTDTGAGVGHALHRVENRHRPGLHRGGDQSSVG